MADAIAGLALFVSAVFATAFRIRTILENDGYCHIEDCGGCPLSGNCLEGYYR